MRGDEQKRRRENEPGYVRRTPPPAYTEVEGLDDYPYRDKEGNYRPPYRNDIDYRGRGPKGYRRSDEKIQEDVCERLTWHPEIDASNLEVDVKDQVVILKGTIENRYMKRLAEDIADDISGVVDVRNELIIEQNKHENLLQGLAESQTSPSENQTGRAGQKKRNMRKM